MRHWYFLFYSTVLHKGTFNRLPTQYCTFLGIQYEMYTVLEFSILYVLDSLNILIN